MLSAMKSREIGNKILQYASALPIVTITGPRQSGKTTLARMLFPEKKYVNLESLEDRLFATSDPKGFLKDLESGAIIDEIQNTPELLSYLQVEVDRNPKPGRFILTGSQNLKLSANIAQSLSGRTAIAHLLPFTLTEAYGQKIPKMSEAVVRGFYPRCFAGGLEPFEIHSFYIGTYLERDIRQLVNVKNALRFSTFIRLCAGRTGQLLNYSTLAADAGISVNTAKDWISILETSFIIKLLPPYFTNISKRLVKTPKLYFLDTGLACSLLNITNTETFENHPLRGSIFETMIVSEMWKHLANSGRPDNLFFYRDQSQTEVDIVVDNGSSLELCEIKSGRTFSQDWTTNLAKVSAVLKLPTASRIVYGGDASRTFKDIPICSWRHPTA